MAHPGSPSVAGAGSHPGLYPSGLVFPFAGSEPHCKIRNQFIPMNHAQASCTQAEKASRAHSLGNPRKIPLLLCNYRNDPVYLSGSPLLRLHTEIFSACLDGVGGGEGSPELSGWGLYTVCRWMALIGNAPSRGVSFNSGYVGGYPWGTGTVPLETALLLNLRAG